MRTSTKILIALWLIMVAASMSAQGILLSIEPVAGRQISMRQMEESDQEFAERRVYESSKSAVLMFLFVAPMLAGVAIVAREVGYHLTKKDSK